MTRTVSIAIYDRVQAFDFASANQTAVALLVLSYFLLSLVYAINRKIWAAGPWK